MKLDPRPLGYRLALRVFNMMPRSTTILRSLVLCFTLGSESILAQSRVLESIEAVPSTTSADLFIKLELNHKLTYLSHTPTGSGTNFQIHVRLHGLGTQTLLGCNYSDPPAIGSGSTGNPAR